MNSTTHTADCTEPGVRGAVRSHTGSTGTEFSFTGEQNPSTGSGQANGLEYPRARYYKNATGRFPGQDPLGGGYPYTGNNPVNRTDPSGLYYIGGYDEAWGGIIEFDSTQVGLSPCDQYGHCYIWSPSGIMELDPADFAPAAQASGDNALADAVATNVGAAAAGVDPGCLPDCGDDCGFGACLGLGPAIIALDVVAVGLSAASVILTDAAAVGAGVACGPAFVACGTPAYVAVSAATAPLRGAASVASAGAAALGCINAASDPTPESAFECGISAAAAISVGPILDPHIALVVNGTVLCIDLQLCNP